MAELRRRWRSQRVRSRPSWMRNEKRQSFKKIFKHTKLFHFGGAKWQSSIDVQNKCYEFCNESPGTAGLCSRADLQLGAKDLLSPAQSNLLCQLYSLWKINSYELPQKMEGKRRNVGIFAKRSRNFIEESEEGRCWVCLQLSDFSSAAMRRQNTSESKQEKGQKSGTFLHCFWQRSLQPPKEYILSYAYICW